MNNRIIFILFLCYAAYIVVSINGLKEYAREDIKQNEQYIAIVSIIKDKLEIKELELKEKQYQIARYNANIVAFQGTACMQCHLAEKYMFPNENRELSLERYIRVVRNGIDGVMPAYINSPRKGPKDITDSELKRQFKLFKDLEKEKIGIKIKQGV